MILLFRAYIYLLLPVLFVTTVTVLKTGIQFGFIGIITTVLIINIIPAAIAVAVSDKIGTTAGKIYKGSNDRTPYRRYVGFIDQARFLKSKNRYDEALVKIDEFLENVPGNPEALYIKAEIIWEAQKDVQLAKQFLFEILKNTNNEDQWNIWAKSLLKKITKEK